MKHTVILFILFLSSFRVCGQTAYGNDWINHSQTYYKIKIGKDGVYRISYDQLLGAGLPKEINPKYIQMYNKGVEVALYISGENDGNLDVGDYIEFYASKNDGKLDKPLYANPADQPHEYYSLYTDTAAYFLTWSPSVAGKRFIDFSAPSESLVPEPYFMHSSISYFTDGGYYSGAYIISHMSVSEYTEGEGIWGSQFYLESSQTKLVNTPFLYTEAGIITGETYVSGRSNSITGGSYNHHLRIETSKDGSIFYAMKDTLYNGYKVVKNTFNIPTTNIGSTTFIKLSAIKDLATSSSFNNYTDYQAPGYVKITYPRQYNLQGEQSLKFILKGLQSSSNSFLKFTNSSFTSPVFLDLTNNLRIIGTQSSGILNAVIPKAGTNKEIYLYDSNKYNAVSLEKVAFTNFSPSTFDKNFLIVTHSSLLNKAQDYLNYRKQTGYKPLIVTTDQLYDQFYYGVHHPLAIRNFCKYLLEQATNKPGYLLLLGKGRSHFSVRTELNLDLVPGIGDPCSDNMFTSGLDGTTWEPAIPTGRIAAQTPEDVEIYLNKLKTYEQQPDSLWRKNFIHISGGNTIYENMQWSGFQNNFFNEASKESFGANVINFQKNVSEPITDNLKNKIVAKINEGAAFLSFFGHGSAQAVEINFGDPSDLQNQNKLLVYMINGCNAGNPFTQISLGEQMIFKQDKAAIGWLATSAEGVASYLGSFSTLFYRNCFNTYYGKSIAENLKTTIKAYQRSNDILNKAHSRQYIWQGDPALSFYSPSKPDYYVENKDLFIYPENVTAATDSFAVAIITKNLGKAINSPLSVSIKHTLPDNTVITYPTKNFDTIYNRDTLYFYIKKDANSLAGTNKFSVNIDANNSISELSEFNNTASLNFFMPSDGIKTLFPANNSIVSSALIELKAQALKLSKNDIEVIFEIDTVKTFNSSWKKVSGTLKLSNIASWTPSFVPENNKVYFWRVKLLATGSANENWQTSSFTFINHSPEGWSESHIDQFEDLTLKGLYWNNNSLAFKNTTFITNIQTIGDDVTTGEERAYRSTPGGRLGFGTTNFIGISIIALNPLDLEPFSYPSVYNIESEIRYSGEYHFNINNSIELDSLIRHIAQIPIGYYVVGHNGRNISLKDLPQSAKAALQSLGLSIFASVNSGEPYMFWGIKGGAPGSAIEKTADPTSPIPSRSQIIKFQKEYYYPFTQGSFMSSTIGPSKRWDSLNYNFQTDNYDVINLDVIGINRNGNETSLFQIPTSAATTKLNNIDASQYPYLKFNVALTDLTSRTPAKLKSWKVLYDAYPESSINTNLKNTFYNTTIEEGDSIKWQLAYQNISTKITDSIKAYYTLIKPDRSSRTAIIKTFSPLNPRDSASVELSLSTKGLVGNNSLKIEFSASNDNDIYSFNNYLSQFFTVIKDSKPPIINVLFDGKNIINNEIVSPKPSIHISILDENKHLALIDTSIVEVSLKKKDEDESMFKREYFSSGKLVFSPADVKGTNKASVDFHPDKFDDGSYTLKVRSKDISGNFNTQNDYLADFEVINESSISNFYPYPNPFTTQMKFVFTLTGDKIPDKIKVQILTPTGKIVREILKEELGPLKIGNNISEFSWDGTDQFGDRLANGVYFFRVLLENNDSSSIKHRSTIGDKFFKNNFGKIYLMR